MARLNFSIPDELDSNLAKAAKILDRSKGYITRKAIEYYLQKIKEELEDLEDAEIALARMNDTTQKLYTSEEFDEILKAKFNV